MIIKENKMDIHILDIIMYFIVMIISWFLIDKFSNGELTQEIGGLIGISIQFLITIIYIILFGLIDWNWIDIFNGILTINWFNLNW